jgi:hypothetical protein
MKTVTTVIFSFLLFISAFAQKKEAFDKIENISGHFIDINSDFFQNCHLIVAQDGDSIFVAHYLEWKGTPMVEYGKGIREGDTITYDVVVTRAIPGWATTGTHTLVLSEDRKTLAGQYSDAKGNTGPLKFKREEQE